MKRLHVNLAVSNLNESLRFYTSLFDAQPTVIKQDYAKWMLDDPRVNFAISTRNINKGIDHLGIQVEDKAELDEVYSRLKKAGAPIIEQGETTCCYARSEKNWISDPEGIAWETFLSIAESPVYGSDEVKSAEQGSSCCPSPTTDQVQAATSCCGNMDRESA